MKHANIRTPIMDSDSDIGTTTVTSADRANEAVCRRRNKPPQAETCRIRQGGCGPTCAFFNNEGYRRSHTE